MDEQVNNLFQKSDGKILTFMLGGREYGIPIIEAREVVGIMETEPIPQTPDFMTGVINLRGLIIPVIDLRIKLGMPTQNVDNENCTLITNIKGRVTGFVIDSLIGVNNIEPSQLESNVDMGANIHTEFITGLVKQGNRVIIILEMEQLLKNDELIHLEKAAGAATSGEE